MPNVREKRTIRVDRHRATNSVASRNHHPSRAGIGVSLEPGNPGRIPAPSRDELR